MYAYIYGILYELILEMAHAHFSPVATHPNLTKDEKSQLGNFCQLPVDAATP